MKYVFVDSNNVIQGACTADRELIAEEVYPGKGYIVVEVEDGDIISNFFNYEFDGSTFNKKSIIPEDKPSDIYLLGQQLVEKDLQILELQQENQTLGSQIVDLDLRLLQGGL